MKTTGRSKADRARALAFVADLYGDNADAWVDGEDCRVGYINGVGGYRFRNIKGQGWTFDAAVDDLKARLRHDAFTYRMDWYDALICCAIDGTLDRENAAQFVAYCEERALEVERRVHG